MDHAPSGDLALACAASLLALGSRAEPAADSEPAPNPTLYKAGCSVEVTVAPRPRSASPASAFGGALAPPQGATTAFGGPAGVQLEYLVESNGPHGSGFLAPPTPPAPRLACPPALPAGAGLVLNAAALLAGGMAASMALQPEAAAVPVALSAWQPATAAAVSAQQPGGAAAAVAAGAAAVLPRLQSFLACLSASSVLKTALLLLEVEVAGSHPAVAQGGAGLQWTLAQLLALFLRAGEQEASEPLLLAALRVLQRADRLRRSPGAAPGPLPSEEEEIVRRLGNPPQAVLNLVVRDCHRLLFELPPSLPADSAAACLARLRIASVLAICLRIQQQAQQVRQQVSPTCSGPATLASPCTAQAADMAHSAKRQRVA